MAVHGAVHDLHHGHRVAQRPRERGSLQDVQPVGHAVAVQVQGQGRDPRRLPRGRQPRADEERDVQPQHHHRGPDHQVPAVPAGPAPAHERAHRQQRLLERAERPDLDPSRVVGRHGGRTLLPAQGGLPEGSRLLVLAHMFLNYLLDERNAMTNISFNGYMQPLTAITPQRLVKEGLLAPNLTSTAVLPSYFRRGVMELQLPATADTLWQQAWLTVSKGI